MNIYQKLALATVGAALSFTAIESKSAIAAIVSRNFTVSDFVGPNPPSEPISFGNSYKGSFSYDDALLNGIGYESIDLSQLTFNFLGNTYTASDDISYPFNPKMQFWYGNPLFLSYTVSQPGFVKFSFLNGYPGPGISSSRMDVQLGSSVPGVPSYMIGQTYFGRVSYSSPTSTSVPEPSALVGLAVFGLGGLLLKKKATSSIV